MKIPEISLKWIHSLSINSLSTLSLINFCCPNTYISTHLHLSTYGHKICDDRTIKKFGTEFFLKIKNGPIPASLHLFSSFSNHNSNINLKSIDVMLVDRTWGHRLVGADR